jgi:two-component system response regulator YesN
MRKVLLIEDDPTMLSLIHMLLELEGFQVAQLDGELEIPAMLETLHRESPDVLLLDVHLRRASGIDLVREMRLDAGLRSTTVLMFSGMEMGAQCREAGADDFILKPFMPDELVHKLRNMHRDV